MKKTLRHVQGLDQEQAIECRRNIDELRQADKQRQLKERKAYCSSNKLTQQKKCKVFHDKQTKEKEKSKAYSDCENTVRRSSREKIISRMEKQEESDLQSCKKNYMTKILCNHESAKDLNACSGKDTEMPSYVSGDLKCAQLVMTSLYQMNKNRSILFQVALPLKKSLNVKKTKASLKKHAN